MSAEIPLLAADIWLAHLFDEHAAREGGVVCRRIADIDELVGWPRFIDTLRERGFHAARYGDRVAVFCDDMPIKMVC